MGNAARRLWTGLYSFRLLVAIMLACGHAGATHLVGGELNYANLGNDNYRVELKLFKDCGTSIVPFDDPATIYVYGSDDQYVFSFEMPLVERDTLDAAFTDPCLLIPPEVCVDFGRYEITVNLPAIPDDYTLAYIRCCRNATILNAEGEDEMGNPLPPDLIGTTYSARIPATPTVNSNPVFNELPPIIVCSGQDINVDQSAFDADGDELRYSLCTPNVGGSLVNVFGDPLQERPPFEQIIWVPPYGPDNIMGGDPPLQIDPVTGFMTGRVPFTVGQFVVGVCVQEFRGGVLLSENKRDFQFNIADCREAIVTEYDLEPAPFQDTLQVTLEDEVFDFVLLCGTELAVQFYNLTDGADTVVWDFGDGSPPLLAEDPVHVFPDTGFYFVTLLGGPGDICADTFTQLINVQYQRAYADIAYEICYDPLQGMQFLDATNSPFVGAWMWDFGDGQTSDAADPVHVYEEEGTYEVSLEITEVNGCRTTMDTIVRVFFLDTVSLTDTLSLCGGDTVLLDLLISGEHAFSWSPSNSLNASDIRNPLAFPAVTTTYTVAITTELPTGDICVRVDSIVVLAGEGLPDIVDATDPFQCDSPVELAVTVDMDAAIDWALDGNFSGIIGEGNAIFQEQQGGITAYYVRAKAYNCISVDTVIVEQRGITVSGDDMVVCRGDETAVRPQVSSLDDDFTFTWLPPGGLIDDAVPEYVFYPEENTTVSLVAENSTGCSGAAEFEIIISTLDELSATATPDVLPNPQLVSFQAVENDIYTYSWEPAGLFDDPSLNGPAAFIASSAQFTVTVTDLNGCEHVDTVYVELLEPCDEQNIFIPSAFSPNGDGLNDLFRITSDIVESLTLSVYDRWGEKVFESHDPGNGWDGTFNGRNLGNDVFGYILKVVCRGGEQFVRQGNVTLVR
jgi:gliding motility-associated-like protein